MGGAQEALWHKCMSECGASLENAPCWGGWPLLLATPCTFLFSFFQKSTPCQLSPGLYGIPRHLICVIYLVESQSRGQELRGAVSACGPDPGEDTAAPVLVPDEMLQGLGRVGSRGRAGRILHF